ncbi:MAG: PAS domain S-box protein [Candidatus Lokiarchaeota archaeon]|nr:PAS domain S-box protein [Candidatus Lokiarchaeota archaeon]
MEQLTKILHKSKKDLKILKQKFENNMELEKLEDYNNELSKIINGIIECVSLSANRKIENSEIKHLERQKKELEEEIKEKNKKLKESEEKFRLITENINDVISVFDKNLNLIFINKMQQKISGFSREEVMGKKPMEFMHPDDIQRSIKLFQEALKNGEGFGEFRLRRKDGSYVWMEVNARIIVDKKGETKAVLVSRDINERKLIEEKLKQAEEKYRYLFENLPFSITLIDLKGNIIDCNPAIERLIGYRKEELINKNFKNLSIIHPKYLPILLKRFKKSKDGEILPSIDIQLYRKDGILIWINYINSLITIGNRKLMQIIFYDITERRDAAKIILEELKKLKELDQIRKNLINRVSHELRTPLVSVWGATELLLRNYNDKLGKEELELIQMIERGTKRLRYLVNNLIDISRVKHKKFKLKKQSYDLTEIIKDCVRDFDFLIKERKTILNLKLPEILYLNIDRIRIEQVIVNLLSNAIKNTPSNGKIQVILQEIEGWAKISIYDTGIGLTKDEMEKLFTRFGKIERYGQGFEYLDNEGAGLGLFISKEIVNLHGGQIWVESSGRHNGSTFVVKLPI